MSSQQARLDVDIELVDSSEDLRATNEELRAANAHLQHLLEQKQRELAAALSASSTCPALGSAETFPCEQGRLRSIASANSLAVVVSRDDESVDVDQRYRTLTGSELDAEFRSVHPDDRAATLQALERREPSIACRVHLADGSWRHVEFRCADTKEEHITVIVDDHRAVEAATKLNRELARLQSQMDQRTSTLQSNVSSLSERNADLDSFAHAAAHDLKAPLRAITMFSSLAAKSIGEEHTALSFLDRIEQSSFRMTNMVDSLLQLASAGRDGLSIDPVDIGPIVQQVWIDLGLEVEPIGASLDIADLHPVMADPAALGIVLTNLIANSVKYRSELPLRVTVSSVAEGDSTTITVADNGIGFDQSKATEIFEPFRRLHSRDQIEGSGVGLAVCSRLTTRLDGEIWATALRGGGAAMSLRLPSARRSSDR